MQLVNKVINIVTKKLNIQLVEYQFLKSNNDKTVILLNHSYIIKIDTTQELLMEYYFYINTPCSYLPNILLFDICNHFLVYSYISGTPVNCVDKNIITSLANLKYSSISTHKYGYLISPFKTWISFIIEQLQSDRLILNSIIDSTFLNKISYLLYNKLTNFSFETKLIHGDLGIYNIILDNQKLVGIIDPFPLIGDPLYDILFFCVSSEKLVTYINLNFLSSITHCSIEKIILLLFPILINRIARQKKNNQNYTVYLEFLYKLWDIYVSNFSFP